MKIAIVNQPICSILPPYQSSVGACSYGLATALTNTHQVTIYGRQQCVNPELHPEVGRDYYDRSIHFRFLPSPTSDQILSKAGRAFFEYVPFSRLLNRGMKPTPSTAGWRYPGYSAAIAQDLNQQQYDVIHVQHSSQFLPAIRAVNPTAKIVFQLHAELFPQSNFSALAERLRYADLITTVSNYVTEKTQRSFPEIADRCETLYNGINAAEFAREKNYDDGRKRSIKRIMYAGRVTPDKGVHVLIEAFKRVVGQYPNVELDVFGPIHPGMIEENFPMNDRGLLSEIEPLYRVNYLNFLQSKLDSTLQSKVRFRGSVPRPELLNGYFDADIFVFPSIWDEGFGLPPVEAMAAGIPVVAARSGAVVETVQHGQTGFLVNKHDVMALADYLLQLLRDDGLRETLGKAGRQRVAEHFTWDRVAETAIGQYTGLVQPVRPLANAPLA